MGSLKLIVYACVVERIGVFLGEIACFCGHVNG